MTVSPTPSAPPSLSDLMAALSVEDILGKAPSLAQITAQLTDTSKRPAKPKPKRAHHEFAPPIKRPPRGPDLQLPQHEITFAIRMRGDIADLHNKLHASRYRENLLTNLLGA